MLFAPNELAATKFEKVAKEAVISMGTIYQCFDSKEKMFEFQVCGAIAPLTDHIGMLAQTSTDDAQTMLPTVFTLRVHRRSDHNVLALAHLVLNEVGRFRRVNVKATVRNVFRLIRAHILLGQIFGMDQNRPQSPQALIGSHLDLLINGLAKPRGAR